ncbi:MAG: molybdopterin-binding protein, partial [Bauldia litoralis]
MTDAPTPAFVPVRFAVLTVSDTRSIEEDRSGTTLAERIEEAGHDLAARDLVRDDVAAIQAVINRWTSDPGIDAVITTGGTGLTGRDVTVEAVEPLLDKRMDGFSTVFHIVSYGTIGTSTIQSRAIAGIARET